MIIKKPVITDKEFQTLMSKVTDKEQKERYNLYFLIFKYLEAIINENDFRESILQLGIGIDRQFDKIIRYPYEGTTPPFKLIIKEIERYSSLQRF